MVKKVNLIFVLFITTILLSYVYVNKLFYIVYIILLFQALVIFFNRSYKYKITYDKKISLLIEIFMIESIVISLIYNSYNKLYYETLILVTMYLLILISNLFIRKYGEQYIDKFFSSISLLLNILNIINIYEIINQKSIFYNFLKGDSKEWQVYVFGTDSFRTFSVFVNAIPYGMFLVCLFWINVFLNRKNKIIYFFSQILILVTLFFTNSRSAWVTLIISLIIYVLNNYFHKLKQFDNNINIKKVIKILSIILIFFILILVFSDKMIIIYNKMYSRMITATSDQYLDISRLQRLGTVPMVNNYMTNNGMINFLFGNGFGSVSKFMESHTVIIEGFTTTDNQYVSFFYEFGFLGLIIYLGILLMAVIKLFKTSNIKTIYGLCLYIFISLSINMFFYEGFHWSVILFMIVFSISIISISSIEYKNSGG